MTLTVVYWPHAETNDHAMKSSRLITLVLLLQQRPANAAELAETLEVSTRTVLRDIDALTLPLFRAARECNGEYDGWETQVVQ